jgi:beta-phosphoglucomutase
MGIIWDVDGTLVDTAELHYQSWRTLAERLGREFTREEFKTTFGRRNPDIIRQVFGANLSDVGVDNLAQQKETLYRAAARRGVSLLPGVRPLLEGLQAAGYRQAIGSSAPRQNLELIMDLTQTRNFFSVIVSTEDTTRGKPDPQVFLIAAERLGIAPAKCLVIEDAVAGVEAARRAGMKSIAVRFVGHHPRETLERAGANLIVDSLEEISVAQIDHLMKD